MSESPNLPGEKSADNEIGFYNADEERSHDESEGTQGQGADAEREERRGPDEPVDPA